MNIRSFRDDNSEYQDHMDISKCIPSSKVSSLPLMDSPEKQVMLDSSNSSPRGHWVGVFPLLLFVFLNLFKLNCKISPFNITCIIIFREMAPPPIIPKLSAIAQTESGLPPVPKRCSGPSSSFIR